jgi:aldose 1-epimerase
MQVHTGSFLGGDRGADGGLLRQGDGMALATQRHPEVPNQPSLGSTLLEPEEIYSSTTV